MRIGIAVVLALALVTDCGWAQANGNPRVPTVDDLLNIKTIGGARISPDGRWVAYSVTDTDFKQDAFVNHLWLANTATGRTFQLTRGDKSAGNPQWSPDSAWLAFTSNRIGDKNQIFAIRPEGGEAIQLTKSESGVNSFDWSRDGSKILFTATEPLSEPLKERKERLGDFEVVRRDYRHSHIWTFDVAEAMREPTAGTQRTKGTDFSVGAAEWSPDGKQIAFSATVNPDLVKGDTSDIYLLALAEETPGGVSTRNDRVQKLVTQAGSDRDPHWSPDGRQIAFTSAMGRIGSAAYNSRIAVVPAAGGAPRSITDAFDEHPGFVEWNANGIYFGGLQKTASHLFRAELSPDGVTGKIIRLTAPDALMASSFSLTRDGRRMAFTAASPTSLSEVFVSDVSDFLGVRLPPHFAPRALTEMTAQVKPFILGAPEVISWKSQDGTVIEGVLVKPAGFDPKRKHPLLVMIHGGPTGIDRPTLLQRGYYPGDVWTGRDALLLKVNYRGSAGYGEAFRRLNIRNLGVGDAWDVLSGVDHLIAKGWVDPARVGCMGWSQGGYISAFLTTSSDRFAAISVGAGISNWATYYYNTDITQFTLNYLGDDPADDPDIYRKTSPMSYIKKARTPTLIQHGENDRRVPIANAYELRQGLEDRGVKVEMIVYKGYGHGITKPKSMRAVMEHNLAWFNHYLWGDPPWAEGKRQK